LTSVNQLSIAKFKATGNTLQDTNG